MRKTMLILALLLSVLAAACGGADDTAEDTDDAGDEAAADVDADVEATTDEDGTAEVDAEVSGTIDAAACQEAADALNAVPSALADATTGRAQAAAIMEQANAFLELADSVPDEYASDFQVLGDTFNEIASALEGIDLESGEVPDQEALTQLQELSTTLSGPEITEASTNVGEYFAAGCPS